MVVLCTRWVYPQVSKERSIWKDQEKSLWVEVPWGRRLVGLTTESGLSSTQCYEKIGTNVRIKSQAQ